MAAWSSGTKMSRAVASFSQVPEALIHMTPSSLSDVLPPAACTSSGSAADAGREGAEAVEFYHWKASIT